MLKKHNALLDAVIAGIQEKKGQNITILDMSEIESSICDYFVVCEGTSTTQVDSIADSVVDVVRERAGEKPLHDEGRENSLWILIDYSDIVVHVFQKEVREFYALESLWSDAKRTDLENEI